MGVEKKEESGMTYAGTGVNYDVMDPFKRYCQTEASMTAPMLNYFGFSEVESSRGESVYLIEAPDCYLAHVEEGLGTKNLVADAVKEITGKGYYDAVAQCTVAMIVNDMITLGALPVSVAMHLAVAESGWLEDSYRNMDLIKGWAEACLLSGAVWSGGETPTLKGIIVPGTVLLSGSALGIIRPKLSRIDPKNIRPGDRIVILSSSGIHANGLTLCREIADKLPEGYATKLSDGQMYGEALLAPTHIYVPVIRYLLAQGAPIHYAINITGHGWRKLMRAEEPFVYVIERVPEISPLFAFIQKQGPVTDKEAYGNLNMGAGFALFVPKSEVATVIAAAEENGIAAFDAGGIEKRGEEKKVIIRPQGLEYDGKTLGVR